MATDGEAQWAVVRKSWNEKYWKVNRGPKQWCMEMLAWYDRDMAMLRSDRDDIMIVPVEAVTHWAMPPRETRVACETDTGRFVVFSQMYVTHGTMVMREVISDGYRLAKSFIAGRSAILWDSLPAVIVREEDAPEWTWPTGNV